MNWKDKRLWVEGLREHLKCCFPVVFLVPNLVLGTQLVDELVSE